MYGSKYNMEEVEGFDHLDKIEMCIWYKREGVQDREMQETQTDSKLGR